MPVLISTYALQATIQTTSLLEQEQKKDKSCRRLVFLNLFLNK